MFRSVHRPTPPRSAVTTLAFTLTVALALAALLATGCTQDAGGDGVDASGKQDTTGVIDDAQPTDASKGDIATTDVSSPDTTTAPDATTAPDTATAPDAATTPDTATAPDAATAPDTTTSKLRWFTTCGDPVCKAWSSKPGVELCTTQKAGDPCSPAAAKCDPKNACNSVLICADSDPKLSPGGCPISARRFKTAIHYLSERDEAGLRDGLLRLPLATWRYRDGARSRRNLGYILEDAPTIPASDMGRERVDLYALSTMAVAAIKAQQRELKALRAELKQVKKACGK